MAVKLEKHCHLQNKWKEKRKGLKPGQKEMIQDHQMQLREEKHYKNLLMICMEILHFSHSLISILPQEELSQINAVGCLQHMKEVLKNLKNRNIMQNVLLLLNKQQKIQNPQIRVFVIVGLKMQKRRTEHRRKMLNLTIII